MADVKIGSGGTTITIGDISVNLKDTESTEKKKNVSSQEQVGQGTVNQTGGVPDVPTGMGAAVVMSFSMIFASSSFAPKRSVDVEITLGEVSATLKENREKTSLESVNANQEKIRTSQKEQQSKLAERKEKIEQSIADDKKGAIAKFFSRLFQAIAMVFTYIAAAVAIATGAGAGLGALLIAGAVAQTIMFANTVTQDATGLGIAGNIAKSMGKSEEEIAKADKVFGDVMMGLSIAISVATIGAQLGPSALNLLAKGFATLAATALNNVTSTGSKLANVGMKMSEVAAKVGEKSLALSNIIGGTVKEGMSATARNLQSVATIGGGVAQVGSGTTSIVTATITYDAQKRNAQSKELEAEGQEIDALIKTLEGLIDMALDMLMNANQISNEMIDTAIQSQNDRATSLSKNMFVG
jgi:hypothetical protein